MAVRSVLGPLGVAEVGGARGGGGRCLLGHGNQGTAGWCRNHGWGLAPLWPGSALFLVALSFLEKVHTNVCARIHMHLHTIMLVHNDSPLGFPR